MNKSIESIWQEGFLNEDALIAPQVNDLYNQKSRHLIDRFDRKFRNNLIGIGLGDVILGGMSDILSVQFGTESLRYSILFGSSFYIIAATLLFMAAPRLKHDWEDN